VSQRWRDWNEVLLTGMVRETRWSILKGMTRMARMMSPRVTTDEERELRGGCAEMRLCVAKYQGHGSEDFVSK